MASTSNDSTRANKRRSRTRKIASINSLEVLLGAHPDGLRDIYESGTPFDPTNSGAVETRLLAVNALQSAFMLTRPLVKALGRGGFLLRGTTFESGGTAGAQQFTGGALRFAAELATSRLDSRPALIMRYASLGNPTLVENWQQELRRVGQSVVIGPLFSGGSHLASAWIGLRA